MGRRLTITIPLTIGLSEAIDNPFGYRYRLRPESGFEKERGDDGADIGQAGQRGALALAERRGAGGDPVPGPSVVAAARRGWRRLLPELPPDARLRRRGRAARVRARRAGVACGRASA